MIARAGPILAASGAALLLAACDRLPGRPEPATTAAPDGAALFATNCAGCHGTREAPAAARSFDDPEYMAGASDAFLVGVAGAGKGVLMPPFAASNGGPVADELIPLIVAHMRERWPAAAEPVAFATPYPGGGDAARGKGAFAEACATCHADGKPAGRVDTEWFLELASDQALWSATVFGRPELGMPGWRGPFGDRTKPLTAREAADVVAYLASLRKGG